MSVLSEQPKNILPARGPLGLAPDDCSMCLKLIPVQRGRNVTNTAIKLKQQISVLGSLVLDLNQELW